jgi:hypothetical protein
VHGEYIQLQNHQKGILPRRAGILEPTQTYILYSECGSPISAFTRCKPCAAIGVCALSNFCKKKSGNVLTTEKQTTDKVNSATKQFAGCNETTIMDEWIKLLWFQRPSGRHKVLPMHLNNTSPEVEIATVISKVSVRIMILSCFYYPAAWGAAICSCPQI